MENVSVRYCFTMTDGSQQAFDLQLDPEDLELTGNEPDNPPAWTDLDFHQCPHCPLTVATHPHCPLAANLVHIVEPFDRLLSYDQVHVDVSSEGRLISQDTTAEQGIGSMMGLVIATSGCPHAAFFKPMARFHLPLASPEETIYRAASMYLLAQYFRKQAERAADLELKGLAEIYRNIQIVNTSTAKRLRAATETDSSLNAIVLLDMFAKTLSLAIDASLKEIRHLFEPFLSNSEEFLGNKT
jgi:hypothetical protein